MSIVRAGLAALDLVSDLDRRPDRDRVRLLGGRLEGARRAGRGVHSNDLVVLVVERATRVASLHICVGLDETGQLLGVRTVVIRGRNCLVEGRDLAGRSARRAAGATSVPDCGDCVADRDVG